MMDDACDESGQTQELEPQSQRQPQDPKNTDTGQTQRREGGRGNDSQAKKPSSSSRRVGAGNGAPGFSWVGRLTYPERSPKGFKDWRRLRKGDEEDEEDVLAGMSGSRRDQPSELTESRKVFEVMMSY